jgi:hypothetical protein
LTAAAVATRTLSVRRYAPEDAAAWDEFVGRSRSAHFLFKRRYMDYHADRFQDHSLLVLDGDRLAGLLPANLRDDGTLVSHGGLTFGGVISDRRMTTSTMLTAFEAILIRLREDGVREWIYKPVPHIYSPVPAEEDLYALFRNHALLVRRDASAAVRLDARLPYAKGRKHSVKQAAEAGLEIARGEDFAEFIELEAKLLADRHGAAPAHTGPELEMLAGRFPDNIKLYTARRAGELLAGVVMYETSAVAHTQYIGASEEGRALGAADAIIDRLIAEHEAAGTSWFDFGISTEDGGRRLNAGLVRNKESYGARAVAYDWYAVPVR